MREADGDVKLAEYGIIYVDEIDKIASSGSIAGPDVSRTGVQRAWQWSLGLTVLYAVSDEIHQGFTAGRHPAAADVAIDAAGAVALLAAAVLLPRLLRSRRRP